MINVLWFLIRKSLTNLEVHAIAEWVVGRNEAMGSNEQAQWKHQGNAWGVVQGADQCQETQPPTPIYRIRSAPGSKAESRAGTETGAGRGTDDRRFPWVCDRVKKSNQNLSKNRNTEIAENIFTTTSANYLQPTTAAHVNIKFTALYMPLHLSCSKYHIHWYIKFLFCNKLLFLRKPKAAVCVSIKK